MLRLSITMTIVLLAGCLLLITACSGSQKGMNSPVDTDISSLDIPVSVESENHQGRSVIAMFEAVIDPDNETFTVTPSQRDAMAHIPLSTMYPNCFQIVDFGFSPNFWADIKITHPMPGSGVDAFDPRVISILPANPGVRFIYPSLYIGGNNRVVLEPDGYTKLFDDPSVLGNVNPFIAYFKDEPYRSWSSTENTSETKRWQMDLDGFGGPMQFKFVVDVSTNFPAPPTPVTDNAPEPVAIEALIGGGLTPDGGSANITVTLLDWQGISTIGGVSVEAPALFNGAVNLSYAGEGQNPNEYMASGTLNNTKLAPAGNYKLMVAAWDINTGIHIYKEFPYTVVAPDTNMEIMWAKQSKGSSHCYASNINKLSDNSLIVGGNFQGEVVLGEGEANETTLISTEPDRSDAFLAKFNQIGSLQWVKHIAGNDHVRPNAVDILSDDSIVMTGSFRGPTTFGAGEANETTLTPIAISDKFVARFNADGTLAWVKHVRVDNTVLPYDIAVSTDAIYTVGGYRVRAVFGHGEPNQTTLTSTGDQSAYLAKYNLDGTLNWVKGLTNSDFVRFDALDVHRDGSIAVTGNFRDSVTMGGGEPGQTTLLSAGDLDVFIARYHLDGYLQWAKSLGGPGRDWVNVITVLDDHSSIIAGFFSDSALFGENEPNETVLSVVDDGMNLFIARYNSDGTLDWAKREGNASDTPSSIALLSDDSFLISGSFYDSITFGLNEANQTTLESQGSADGFMAYFNSDGTLEWASREGNSDFFTFRSITKITDNSFAVMGRFSNTVTLGMGQPNETVLSSDATSHEMYIAKYQF